MSDTTSELRQFFVNHKQDIPYGNHTTDIDECDYCLALLDAQRQRWEVAARIDQIIQDALSLSVETDIDESLLIQWRIDAIAALDGERGKEQ